MNKKCITVGVTGPTTAGKTTISQLLSDNYNCTVLHEDKYFNYPRVFGELGGNRQLPEAIDRDKFAEDVQKQIQSGKHELLVVQGFQLYYSEAILKLLDVKVFLDIDDQTIHYRRMKVNKCTEEYFKDFILKQFHLYRDVVKKVPDVQFVDSSRKIAEVYRDVVKLIKDAQSKP